MYYPEIREIRDETLTEGRHTIRCLSYEKWVNTNESYTLRCGQKVNVSVSITLGTSETLENSLKSSIGGSLGFSEIASLKSSIESHCSEIKTWSKCKTTTRGFEFGSDPCNFFEHTIYQLRREHRYEITTNRLVRQPKKSIINIEEYLPTFDVRCNSGFDLTCGCNESENNDSATLGDIILKFGDSIFGTDLSRLGGHNIALFPGCEISVSSDAISNEKLTVEKSKLSPFMLFILETIIDGETGDHIEFPIEFHPFENASIAINEEPA